MAEKSFGVKEINLIGASGTPTIESPNNLNLNAVNVAISTNATIGGNLTVSGTVGIAGTLTYEDVTNVDAVGIITARDGIHVGAGVSVVGVGTFGALKVGSGVTIESSGQLTSNNNIRLSANSDNHSATARLQLGSDQNFEIYHNASRDNVINVDRGNLVIMNSGNDLPHGSQIINRSDGQFLVANQAQNKYRIKAYDGGAVELYYNNVERFETTSQGINVIGHSELDNVNIAGVSTFAGAIDANGDLDVDGHTNLDNVSIVGVTTFNGLSTNDVIRVRSADSNGNCVVNILSEGTTGNSRILFSDTAATSGDGWISYSHNDRALTFTTAGTSNERLRIDSNGRILYGFTSNFTGAKLQLNLGAGGSAINIFTASNDANGSILDLYKTRGTAPNNYTALQDGDFIGELRFRGTTGSSYVNGAVIQAKVNGTTGSGNDLPTDLIFRLQPDGSGNTGEVFRITGSGKVLVGDGNSVSPSRHLDVRGSGQQQILIGSTNNQGASIIFDGHGGGDGSGGNYAGVEMGADGHFDIRNYDPNKNIIFGVGSNVGGNDSVTITSAGRVLIGTSDEGHGNADDLTVATAGGSLGHTGITIRSGTSSDGNIFFSDATSGGGETIGGIKYKHGGAGSNPETLNFIANGLTRATVGATYLYVDDGTNGRITLQPESTNVNQILSTTTAFGSYCNLKYQAADHIFLYGGSERFRIHNSGAIGLSGANYGSSGQVLTSQGSGSAVTWSTVSTQDTLSFRNMIINGAAMISQRLGNSTYNLSSAASYYPVDRFRCWAVGGGTLLIQRSDDAPSGFQNSIMFTVNTTDTDALSVGNTYYVMQQRIEGYDTRRLNMGQSNAQSSTLSFWVKSDVQGTYGVMLNNHQQNRSYLREYTVSNTNTWEYKTLTYPGDTTGTWNHESLSGVQLNWCLASGSNYQGTANQWNSAWRDHSSNQVNFMATSGNKIRFTGIQLEKGTTATEFEHRSLLEEYIRCQRFYQQDLSRNRRFWGSGNVSNRQFPVRFDVDMRDTPSVSFTSTSIDSGSLSANGINRQGYYTNMSGSGRFYEWRHTADAEL